MFGNTREELMSRLDTILHRLRLFNITLNPSKVKIGLEQVEYLGHVIDKHGLSFSKEKKDKVFDFRKPSTAKEMKSFLGLTVQFRDHVQNFGDLAAPLHAMIPNYKKNSSLPLRWSEDLDKSFYKLQEAIADCTKLYFINDEDPIFLHTDASKYGIGAYLFQEHEGVRRPISFISRSLNKTELKWSVQEKEAYAIFYAFMKLEHLIRDRHFVLRTDNKNLTFLNVDHREKVKRWKLAIQHFDFQIEHIAGVDNIEADQFSRLVHFPDKEEHDLDLNDMEVHEFAQQPLTPMERETHKKIQSAHGGPQGHGGVQRTLNLLAQQKLNWKGMRGDVKKFIISLPLLPEDGSENS